MLDDSVKTPYASLYASSFITMAHAKIRLIPRDGRALPTDLLLKTHGVLIARRIYQAVEMMARHSKNDKKSGDVHVRYD
jgi:hypothetical protein